jgi:hypothetical protein
VPKAAYAVQVGTGSASGSVTVTWVVQ